MAAPSRKTVFLRTLAASVAAAALLSAQSPAIAKVGVAAAVNTDAKGRAPGGAPRVISLGQTVIFKEEIVTDARGLVQVLLLDGTTFTVGPNSQLTIDEFVYNPATGDAKVVASVAKGAFRFIGGQTSRRPDGAKINTPVGTIGIRGAMVEGRVESSDKALFSMIFGDEVNFSGRDGKRSRIYEPGYTLVVQGGGGGLDTNVRRRTESDASTFQTAFSGGDGQNGGTEDPPTDNTVEQSPLPQSNSNLPTNAPIPTARSVAVKSTDIREVENKVAELGDVSSDNANPGILARALTAPEQFVLPGSGSPYDDAGQRGLVGTTPESDRVQRLFRQGSNLVDRSENTRLPDFTGPEGDSFLEAYQINARADGRFVSGTAYAGRGDFAAYMLGYEADPTQPYYLITGTPTSSVVVSNLNSGNNIRQYKLTQDPIEGIDAPFFFDDRFGSINPDNLSSTNLYIVESNTSANHDDGDTNYDAKVFQSWIYIEGIGESQKSAAQIFVTPVAITPDGDATLGGARRGSFRYNALAGPANMRGSLGAIEGVSGNTFFGANADHFVLGTSVEPADGYSDELLGPGFDYENGDGYLSGGYPFSTHHIAALFETTPQASLFRTSRTVTGYISGIVESDAQATEYIFALSSGVQPTSAVSSGVLPTFAMSSGVQPTFTLSLDAQTNDVSASGVLKDRVQAPNEDGEIVDVLNTNYVVERYELAFGPGEGGGGGSAFVNDDIFGANHNSNNANTRLVTEDGQELASKTGDPPGSYLVSGRANPIDGFAHCTECTFLDWGWWGTRVRTDYVNGETTDRTDYAHMGTWVAGDITDPDDLPTNIVGIYEGTALANVARSDGAKYIAAGTMGMTFDFNAREGQVNIEIDDLQLFSEVNGNASGLGQSHFAGQMNNLNHTVTGGLSGAFVNTGDPFAGGAAGGVIGNFSFQGEGRLATGTIAGIQTKTMPSPAP